MQVTRDARNATYQSTTSVLFEADGRLRPFQRAKYQPKLERLLELGIGSRDPILDVGVGYGAWLSHLERAGFQDLSGMDPFEDSIALARERTRARFSLGRIEDEEWPFPEGHFAAITCFDVIEHLEDPPLYLRRVVRYLRPGGVAIVTTPLLELGYRCRWLPFVGLPDTNPTHINVRPPEYWVRLAGDGPLELLETWRGESLTHLRLFDRIGWVIERVGVDHRRIPGLRQFEQSFCMTLRRPVAARG
jgi:SAM-dependent methyltransferase